MSTFANDYMETIVIGLLIPLLGTMLGSAFVFLMKDEMSVRLQKSLLGFASGVMVAASVWSLLIPSMEMEVGKGAWSVFPAAFGFLLGMGFLLLIDELTPHLHIGTDKPEGMRSHLSKTAMLALAVTIHNLPEGMAVGVVFAGAENGAAHISLASAAYWSRCRLVAGIYADASAPLYVGFCRRCHVLCGGRGTDTRSLQWSALESQHDRLCCWFCPDDGTRRCNGLNRPSTVTVPALSSSLIVLTTVIPN